MSEKQKDYQKNMIFVAAFLCIFGSGFLYLSINNLVGPRDIASVELEQGATADFVARIKIETQDDKSILNVPLQTSDGQSYCSKYSELKLHFHGNIAVSGQKPEMLVSIICSRLKSEEFVKVEVLNQSLLKRSPSSDVDQESQEGVELVFNNVSWEWPDEWALSEVEFQGSLPESYKPKTTSDIKRIPWK